MLDLAKLKNAANANSNQGVYRGEPLMVVQRNHELCTIEESKRSEPLHDSESYYNVGPISQTIEATGHAPNMAGSIQRPGSSGSVKPGKLSTNGASSSNNTSGGPQLVATLNHRKGSSNHTNINKGSSSVSSRHSQNQALNRCGPHDPEEGI